MKNGQWAQEDSNEIRTICKLCLNSCGMILFRTEEGIKIKGDPNHPLSRGFLCKKGLHALEIGNLPNRLLYPLKRIGERGSGKWESISWDEAIEGISSKLKEVIDKYGGESVCVQSLPPKDITIWQAFAKTIETPNFFRHDHHVCFTPQLIADTLTFGHLITYPNLTSEEAKETNTVVLWGINMPETNPAKAKIIDEALSRGAKLIVIDPRPIKPAREGDIWMRVRPGTDCALALGMINVIIKERLYDEEFVTRWTYGFERLVKHVEDYTPEKVEKITWVPKEKVIEGARLIAKNRPTAIFTFIGLAMGGNSINTMRSLGIILAITGNVDRKGGNFIKIPPKTGKMDLTGAYLEKQISADTFPLLSGPTSIVGAILPSGNPADVINTMLTGKPYPLKALLTDCNPVTALEDSKRAVEAFLNLDLFVVFELFMTPSAEFADYVLPITWFLESNGIAEYSGMNFIAARKRVFKPSGEAKEEGEILIDILKSMNMADRLPFSTYKGYLDYRLKPQNITFDQFTEGGYILNENVEKKYEKGLLREDRKPGFNTPTTKIELSSTTLEKYGYDPIPEYREPLLSPYSTEDVFLDYPFIMITGARYFPHYHGLGLQIPAFRKLHPDPLCEINREAAQLLGVKEGDWVYIETPGRKDRIRRRITVVEGLHKNVVCVEGHWYLPEEKEQEKRLWDVNANVITTLGNNFDPVVGGSGCRTILCRLTKI
ncbi:MAG: molybdopterin-dependent oxidoreductase [Syntrophorhabdaceae bacterium]|nr:molybdopterin-dependent oxidoreductase [Syntrophorhabdaceae bacterium]